MSSKVTAKITSLRSPKSRRKDSMQWLRKRLEIKLIYIKMLYRKMKFNKSNDSSSKIVITQRTTKRSQTLTHPSKWPTTRNTKRKMYRQIPSQYKFKAIKTPKVTKTLPDKSNNNKLKLQPTPTLHMWLWSLRKEAAARTLLWTPIIVEQR